MASSAKGRFDEKALSRTRQRKLKDMRKAMGQKEGLRAFKAWLAEELANEASPPDPDAEAIATALNRLVRGNRLSIPRGGYLVTRGRKRVIVNRAQD